MSTPTSDANDLEQIRNSFLQKHFFFNSHDKDIFWKSFWYNLDEGILFSLSFKNLVLWNAKLMKQARPDRFQQ